jgi:tetratricopeptide (TPR) repeat protein
VDRLEAEQKWPEALAAARRAEAALTGGEADAEITERVRQRLKDLELIDRLEQIRMENREDQAEIGKRDRDYARAFRDYGVDVEGLAVEASIERLKARPVLTIPLAVALDGWVSVRPAVSQGEDAGRKRLVAVAHGIDPEPVRDRLRSAPWPLTPQMRDELRRLAESINVRAHHPATLYRLAATLRSVEPRDAAIRMLRDAQALYPGDYWLNYELGTALYYKRNDTKQNYDEAIRFYTVAVAIRPSAAARVYTWLSMFLRERGDLDEAVAVLRRAIEINPKHPSAPYTDLGGELSAQGKPDEAIAVYRQAIEARPEAAGYYWGYIGAILRARKKPAEAADADRKAIAAHRWAIENNPKDSSAPYRALGSHLNAQGKPDEAIAVYRKAMEGAPSQNHH